MFDTIIIIPYRNRKTHIEYFIKNSVPILQKELPNSKLVIIEQDWNNNLFNRGCLLNIGVKEYQDNSKYIITHDVDINPLYKSVVELYKPDTDNNNIRGIYNLSSNCDTLGGIIKMKTDTFIKINGFPNDIWGWGAEDIALKHRADYFNIKITKTFIEDENFKKNYEQMNKNENFVVFNDINDRNGINNGVNIYKYNLSRFTDNKIDNIYSSGFNNLNYKIIEKKHINDYVELITVSI